VGFGCNYTPGNKKTACGGCWEAVSLTARMLLSASTSLAKTMEPEALQQNSTRIKLVKYLFNPDSRGGWPKGQWFIKALGFDPTNPEHIKMLEEQIVFDKARATLRSKTQYGVTYNLTLEITGPNGKTIGGVVTGWQKDKDTETFRLVTVIPPKR
jgi:hypothetical protein